MNSETQDSDKNTADFSGQELADQIDVVESSPKADLATILDKYPLNERKKLIELGADGAGVEVYALGKADTEQLATASVNALTVLNYLFGDRVTEAFSSVKIYFADGAIEGGGQAFTEENAIVIDAKKGQMSLTDVEGKLVADGILTEKDWTKLGDEKTSYAEITIIHELGHLLEAKCHGRDGIAFAGLPQGDAPTKYGSQAANEDYAESFTYLVYGKEISEERAKILQEDIQKAA